MNITPEPTVADLVARLRAIHRILTSPDYPPTERIRIALKCLPPLTEHIRVSLESSPPEASVPCSVCEGTLGGVLDELSRITAGGRLGGRRQGLGL